jgi:salicylate hydroxylase
MNEQEVSKWALWDSLPLTTYCRGNIALLGDAAHASLPHQGAGAGQAIEDALVLSEVLAVAHTKEHAALALKAYDVIRRPRSQAVVKTSRDAGNLFKLYGPEGFDMSRIGDNLLTRMNWIWYESMELQINRAVEVFEILAQRK